MTIRTPLLALLGALALGAAPAALAASPAPAVHLMAKSEKDKKVEKQERQQDRKHRAKEDRRDIKVERREDRHERAEDLQERREDAREHAEDRRDRREDRAAGLARYRSHARDIQRERMNVYYRDQYRRGYCPPGFSRSSHRCDSPRETYGWRSGYRLPSTIVYYDLPAPLYSMIEPAPYGYRYIQVGGDILLIDLATLIVVDSFALSYY
jgi:hypothetical protein